MDKTVIAIIIAIILVGGLFWVWQLGVFTKTSVQVAPLPQGIVLFYGDGCPHCKNVEDFITQNKIEDKVKFTRLEIPFNGRTSKQLAANADLAVQVAEKCKLDVSNGLIIPLLYDGNNQCLTGDVDTINFFKNAAGIQ